MKELDARLRAVLSEGQHRGLVGPGDLAIHIEHALGFLGAAASAAPSEFRLDDARVLDLGSGGGLPGLVLAASRPDLEIVLLDANLRSTTFLDEVVEALDLGRRVTVVRARAETRGRDASWRERFDIVVARGFGRPAVTAECGSPFLRVDGCLVVSEPPADKLEPGSRWPPVALAELGLRPLEPHKGSFAYHVLLQDRPCPNTYPRRSGVPTKRPLF